MADYKAKQMKPINPMGTPCKGEYCGDMVDGAASKPSTKPAKADAKSSMIDGPFGGKKPE